MKKVLAGIVVLLLVVTACQDHPNPVDPDHVNPALQTHGNQVDVVVVLKREFAPGGREANRLRAAEVALGAGIDARFTYGSALFGFAGSIPEARLNALRRHPLVEYVDLDGIWDFEHSAMGEAQGAWQASTQFPGPGEYAVDLIIRVGTATATHSQPVACVLRGRNLRCG